MLAALAITCWNKESTIPKGFQEGIIHGGKPPNPRASLRSKEVYLQKACPAIEDGQEKGREVGLAVRETETAPSQESFLTSTEANEGS